jgi:CRISPR-associated exonuclease Cas4
MREAVKAQDVIERLETRRSLRGYGWEGARRRFGLWLASDKLGLNGKLDLLLERGTEGAVVDFKLTSGEMGENHRMQLSGYAVLVQACLGLHVETAFLYRIPDDRIFSFTVTAELKQRVTEAVRQLQELERSAWCPEPTAVRARCAECEYANFCADIW